MLISAMIIIGAALFLYIWFCAVDLKEKGAKEAHPWLDNAVRNETPASSILSVTPRTFMHPITNPGYDQNHCFAFLL